jgi:hypothetical protein
MAGLDPAIDLFKKALFWMDARVKPVHDVSWIGAPMISARSIRALGNNEDAAG